MNDFRADLHCHTTCSDGSLSPEQIIRLAKQIGLSGLSITDHDTIDAYAVAVPLCQEIGVELLTGVELSTTLNGVSVHVLAYGFDPSNPLLKDFCAKHIERRIKRNQGILDLLSQKGMPLTMENVSSAVIVTPKTIGRPHIAMAMVKKGYVASIQEAFQKFLAEDKPCYTAGETFSVQESLDVIHKANALAVIAHPHLLNNNQILDKLLEMDFDGIECYYGKFHSSKHERWLKIAKKRNWVITGGSDFHGTIKPAINLGCSWVDREAFNAIKQRLNANL